MRVILFLLCCLTLSFAVSAYESAGCELASGNVLLLNAEEENPGFIKIYQNTGNELHHVAPEDHNGAVNYLLTGLYYGFVFMVLTLCLLLFTAFRERYVLYYVIFLFTITLSIAHSDGLLALVLGKGALKFTGPVSHLLTGIAGILFGTQLLNIKGRVKFRWYGLLLTGLLYITGLVTGAEVFSYIADWGVFIVLASVWIAGFEGIKTNLQSRYVILAYAAILFAGMDFYILKPVGISVINASHIELKLAGIIEMTGFIVFTIYKIALLRKENRLYKIEINEPVNETAKLNFYAAATVSTVNYNHLKTLYGLTDCEVKVLKCITGGFNNTQISKELFISVNTVKYHVRNIYEKLDINSKSQAISKILGPAA